MNKCKLRIVEDLEELDVDPEFFKHIRIVDKHSLKLSESALHVKNYNFVYINEEDKKICAIIRFYIVEWEDIKYAYIYSVGSRAYYDLEYKGYGRKIFDELFDFLRKNQVKIVCIFDFTAIGYEMYLKIGFRVVGADKFLYINLNKAENKITCDDIKYVLTIDMILNHDYFQESKYMYLDQYAEHNYAFVSKYDRFGQNFRPYTDPIFIQEHTDIIDCKIDIEEIKDLYEKMRKI